MDNAEKRRIRDSAYLSGITLVPFAGINPIRFRGSRINGLSLCSTRTLGTPTRYATGKGSG